MRVAFVSHTPDVYGAGRSLLDLIWGLRSSPVEPLVLVPCEGPLQRELDARGIDNLAAPIPWWAGTDDSAPKAIGRLGLSTLSATRLAWQLSGEDLDVVYSNSAMTPVGALVSGLLGIPHVWHIREWGNKSGGHSFDWGLDRTSRWIGQGADQVVTISEVIRNLHAPHIPYDRLHRIYDGVRLDDADTAEPPKFPDLSPERFLLSIVGKLHPSKRQMDAVKAVAQLANLGYDVHLQIIGKGSEDYERKIREYVEDHGINDAVSLHGFVEYAAPIQRRSDALLVCSRSEALGRVTIEAMLAGTPVVGARSGATPEIIADGETGFLYEPRDVRDLASKIQILVENPKRAQRMTKLAAQRARNRFDPDEAAAQILDVIEAAVRSQA